MKRYSSIVNILSLTCACLVVAGCTTGPGTASAPPPNSARVLIYRVANFGENLGLVVSVDGKDVGTFSEGQNYSGYLPAGQHVITVRTDPHQPGVRPGRKSLTVRAGQTYSFTAAYSGGNLVLVRNQGQIVIPD
jgi:hypothetical protein